MNGTKLSNQRGLRRKKKSLKNVFLRGNHFLNDFFPPTQAPVVQPYSIV